MLSTIFSAIIFAASDTVSSLEMVVNFGKMYFETGSDSEFSVKRYDMIIHEIITSLKKALKRVRTLGKRVTKKVKNRTIFAINFLFLNIKSLILK